MLEGALLSGIIPPRVSFYYSLLIWITQLCVWTEIDFPVGSRAAWSNVQPRHRFLSGANRAESGRGGALIIKWNRDWLGSSCHCRKTSAGLKPPGSVWFERGGWKWPGSGGSDPLNLNTGSSVCYAAHTLLGYFPCRHGNGSIQVYTHTCWAKTKEGTGTPSVLISCCCCVLEAAQGSAVIGLFSYWAIQSRTKGYRSERSDPRAPLPAFPPSLPSTTTPLLPPSLSNPTQPLAPKHQLEKICRTWQAWRLERGHGNSFSGHGSKSPQPNGRIWEADPGR